MAVYKNREVTVMSYVTNESPTVEIMHRNGDREQVKLREVAFTEDEKKNLVDETNPTDSVTVIKDKDLKELRDSQDREKIEAEQKKNKKSEDVSVSSIKVNADEVKQKASK